MKDFRYIYIILLFTLPFFFAACEDDENFSTNSSLKIAFSNDTVRFDTIFTEIGSATYRLKVYNRNSDALNIESVKLMGAGKSGFRMNVDGESGEDIKNVAILGKDSISVFIEVTVDPQNSNNAILIRDSIRFSFNGNDQYVQLEAIGQDAIKWHGKLIEENTTLTNEKPYLIYDSLYVNEGVTLTIEKGAKLHFHSGARVVVKGNIYAKGTLEEPIIFRGERYDNILTNVPYDNIPGQWAGIEVSSSSYDNYFEYVKIRNTQYGIKFESSDVYKQKATFLNCILHNSLGDVLSAENCRITAQNSLFSNAKGACVRLTGGFYSFIHCTLANYIAWRSIKGHESGLVIGNYIINNEGEQIPAPVYQCEFLNSIVAGSNSTELFLNNKNSDFKHTFRYCLLKVKEINKPENFFNNLWAENPKFKYLNENDDYYFNFELDSDSPAINKASREYSQLLPYDIRGVLRLNDEAPDMGCYEWVKTEE